MKTSLKYISTASLAVLFAACSTVKAPQAILPVPQEKQVDWQKMGTYAFIHFGLNTFNDREWGYGDSNPQTFNPVKLDCEQWAKTLSNAGMKGVILTAKHHDGFCLWPTQLTEYSIRNTPFKGGNGDVVGDLSKACRKYGLKFAVYLSPWDRHQANYGTPEYVEYFYKQLHELLTKYGDVFEIWFDGANGGDGWYGGTKEKRTIDRRNYYNYPRAYAMIDSLQPQAVIFSDGGPGCRWVGNESGFAGATNWSFLRKGEVYPGYPKNQELQYGHADGNQWVPAECDVSIRPGWFYHPEEDSRVKSVEQLTDLYYRSVGHNATMLLNFPVDRNGLINPIDSANAVNFHKRILQELSNNLFAGIKPKVTDERGGKYSAKAVTDGNYDTYWATKDGVTSADIEFTLPKADRVNRMMIQEYIPQGQRVKSFIVEFHERSQWLPVTLDEETTTVGYKRLLRFKTVDTDKLRVRFTEARGPLCISNIEAFYVANDKGFMQKEEEFKTLPFTVVTSVADESRNEMTFDLGEDKGFRTFSYLPVQDSQSKGMVSHYEISVSSSPESGFTTISSGEFSNIKSNPILQIVRFTPVRGRYVKFKATRMINEQDKMAVGKIGIR